MFARLLVLTAAVASALHVQPVLRMQRHTVRSDGLKAAVPLAARAGQPNMLFTETGATMLGATGVLAWIAPKLNVPGFKGYDDTAAVIVRAIGAWQICLAAVLMIGKQTNITVAAGYGLYAAALTVVSIIPVWEGLGREKISQVSAALLFALLGKFTLRGAASPYVAPASYLLTGTLIYFTPKSTAALYELSKPLSDLALSMLSLYGGVIATCGIYLAGSAYGLTHPQSFAAAFATNALISVKWAIAEAAKLGTPKLGPLAWAAISAVLSGLALK